MIFRVYLCEKNLPHRDSSETGLMSKYVSNLTKVRPLFTLWHRGSDNSPLLIVFIANYIDQLIVTFMRLNVG